MSKFEVFEKVPSKEKVAYLKGLERVLPTKEQFVSWYSELKQENPRTEFTVRGHHIFTVYRYFVANDLDKILPIAHGKTGELGLSEDDTIALLSKAVLFATRGITESEMGMPVIYYIDLFGDSYQGLEKFTKGLMRQFHSLLTASVDCQVRLTMGNDDICDLCCVGEHCSMGDYFSKLMDCQAIRRVVDLAGKECTVLDKHGYLAGGEYRTLPKEAVLSMDAFRKALIELVLEW